MLDVKRNLTTIMDFYELTMAAGYLEEGFEDKISVFDMFFRTIPDSLDQSLPVHDRYFGAIVLGVLSNDSGSTSERTAFLNEADCAYRSLWREAAAHRQIGVAEGGLQ